MAIDWYKEFVDLKYEPAKDDLVCLFYFEPAAGISGKEAAGRIASESSTGTWTTLFTMPPRMKALQATAFDIEGNVVKIAYPLELWEEGNAVQLLSGIAGNIFGMKAVKNLRLIDAALPAAYLKHFKGPHFGNEGIRKMMKVRGRPLTGAVPKPKIGFSAKEHAEIGYETWMGGFDFVKDDENLTSTSFNRFDDRVKFMTKLRDKAEKETGEVKSAFLNITADVETMKKRADLLAENGWNYCDDRCGRCRDRERHDHAGLLFGPRACDPRPPGHARDLHPEQEARPEHAVPGKDHASCRRLPDPYRDRGREADRLPQGIGSARRPAPREEDEGG